MDEVLNRIAFQLHGIPKNELSTAEENIARILIKVGKGQFEEDDTQPSQVFRVISPVRIK